MPLSGSWKTAEKRQWQLCTEQDCTQAVLNWSLNGIFKAQWSLVGAGQISVVGKFLCLVLSLPLLLSFRKKRNIIRESKYVYFPDISFMCRALAACILWSWFATGPERRKEIGGIGRMIPWFRKTTLQQNKIHRPSLRPGVYWTRLCKQIACVLMLLHFPSHSEMHV